MNERVSKQEKEKNYGGFPTSGSGTITGNGSASSSTGNLPVMVLTYTCQKVDQDVCLNCLSVFKNITQFQSLILSKDWSCELSGSSLGALWELSGSSQKARCSCGYYMNNFKFKVTIKFVLP
jgi:hypothetical protein